jgi:LysM repeat protein
MTNIRSSQSRKYSRAEVYWPVTVINKQSVLPGRVKDLSRGGALLYLQSGVESQANIRVAIEIPKYNYVISAKAEVIRSSPLGEDIKHFAFAVAVRFTEISHEDLKFFSGNLAPEWQKDYKEKQNVISARATSIHRISFGLLGVLVLALMIYSFSVYNMGRVSVSQIAALEKGLEDVKSQLTIIQKEGLSNKKLSGQIYNIQNEISAIKKNFVTIESIEPLQEQINNNLENIAAVSRTSTNDNSKISDLNSDKKLTLPPTPVYHIVKKGENLYRIALMYNLDLNEVRAMNNLSPNELIRPNQKLLIQ